MRAHTLQPLAQAARAGTHVEHQCQVRLDARAGEPRSGLALLLLQAARHAEHDRREKRAIREHGLAADQRGLHQLIHHLRFAGAIQQQLRLRAQRVIARIARELTNHTGRAGHMLFAFPRQIDSDPGSTQCLRSIFERRTFSGAVYTLKRDQPRPAHDSYPSIALRIPA